MKLLFVLIAVAVGNGVDCRAHICHRQSEIELAKGIYFICWIIGMPVIVVNIKGRTGPVIVNVFQKMAWLQNLGPVVISQANRAQFYSYSDCSQDKSHLDGILKCVFPSLKTSNNIRNGLWVWRKEKSFKTGNGYFNSCPGLKFLICKDLDLDNISLYHFPFWLFLLSSKT